MHALFLVFFFLSIIAGTKSWLIQSMRHGRLTQNRQSSWPNGGVYVLAVINWGNKKWESLSGLKIFSFSFSIFCGIFFLTYI